MKRLLLIALLGTFSSVAWGPENKPKLGDAYGVAALRFVIARNAEQDKSAPLLNELEAQISSDAEESSYNGILTVIRADRDRNKAINTDNGGGMTISRYYEMRQACYDSLKTNLKRRDASMPKECTEAQ